MFSDFELNLNRQISGLKTLRNISELTKTGDRFMGTKGDRKAIGYMKRQFKSYGLDIKELPVKALIFKDEKPHLQILATREDLEQPRVTFMAPLLRESL